MGLNKEDGKGDKMKYYSEKLDKLFDTEEALFKAEKAADEVEKQELAKQTKLLTEKQEAIRELQRLGTEIVAIRKSLRAKEQEQDAIYKKLCSLSPKQPFSTLRRFEDYDSVFDYVNDIFRL